MEQETLIHSWFVWREAYRHLQLDKEVITSSPIRFPLGYDFLLQFLMSGSQFMAQANYRKLRQRGVRILGEHKDQDEYFIMWQFRQETGMLRLTRHQLKVEMQQKVEELIQNIGHSSE